jgi:membrane-bound lytic murein transglycosylase A
MKRFRPLLSVAALLTLSACAGGIVPPADPSAPTSRRPVAVSQPLPRAVITPSTPIAPVATASTAAGPNARSAGVVAGPDFMSLNLSAVSVSRAFKAFKASCQALLRRTDQSGLTSQADWQPACALAGTWPADDAVGFFRDNFDVAQIGTGAAFATGYYVPEIEGSRTRRPGYDVPVYGRPAELVEIDLGAFSESLKGKKIRGKVNGNTFVPFADRGQIEKGALDGRGLEIAWAKDAVDFFVLQIQGSGSLRLPDGSKMQIGYDGQNGRDYTGIGKVMRDRGLLAPGQASMQGITAWIRANPEQGAAIMRENRSWVFFRELKNTGALGALGVEVVGRATVAADPMFVPLGAPVVLSMDRAEPNGLWVAQDTGGAIKGANRFDTFWGGGSEAATIAGGMSAKGTSFLLLPRGTVERLNAGKTGVGTTP